MSWKPGGNQSQPETLSQIAWRTHWGTRSCSSHIGRGREATHPFVQINHSSQPSSARMICASAHSGSSVSLIPGAFVAPPVLNIEALDSWQNLGSQCTLRPILGRWPWRSPFFLAGLRLALILCPITLLQSTSRQDRFRSNALSSLRASQLNSGID